tara:strand:+ start:21320 stop:24274 length:2955 start_codon:yes stop_codon:yes gene_type:complete
MATNLIQTTFSTEYKDDYRDSDNYHRILFNSGRALQARELTQSQTIIQAELARVGSFLFNEGGMFGSSGNLSSGFSPVGYVKLVSFGSLSTDYPTLVGTKITNDDGISATVKATIPTADGDPDTLLVRYISSNGKISDDTSESPETFKAGETLNYSTSSGSGTLTIAANNQNDLAIGKGSMIEIPDFNTFVAGHFVFIKAQSLVISKYDPAPNTVVGYVLSEDVVTVGDDNALYDNTGSTPNLTSPGADRYRITMTLLEESNTTADQTFYPFLKMQGGVTRRINQSNSTLNELGNILNARTNDITGNFIVDNPTAQFGLTIDEDSDNNFLRFNVGGGVLFVNGNRVERRSASNPIRVEKPRSTTSDLHNKTNEFISSRYGNYVLADSDKVKGLINHISDFSTINLYDDSGKTSAIGTTRIRNIQDFDNEYRIHLFDVNLNAGKSFRNVKAIGTDSSDFADLKAVNGIISLIDKEQSSLLMPIGQKRIQSITNVTMPVTRIATDTTNVSGVATFQVSDISNNTFTDGASWMVEVDSDGEIFSPPSYDSAGGTVTTITGLPASKAVTLLAYENKSAIQKIKRLQSNYSESRSITGRTFTLTKPDIYIFKSVVEDATGLDITNRFIFDNGQRDDFYTVGSGTVKSGSAVPGGNVTVTYDYFTHTAGDYFAGKNSYPDIAYEKVPRYVTSTGSAFKLTDVIDMRPVKNNTGEQFTGAGSVIEPLPKNGATITAGTVANWMGRRDIVHVSNTGLITVTPGVSSANPAPAAVPLNEMLLHDVSINPYTFNENDLSIKTIDHRGFKMADIRRMDDRLSNVEKLTALTVAEMELQQLDVQDPNDATLPDRVKQGITGDTFNSNIQSYMTDLDYRARIDRNMSRVSPMIFGRSITLYYDSDTSSNVQQKGNTVWPEYTEEVYINQNIASKVINVNQFEMNKSVGSATIEPPRDAFTTRKKVDANYELGTTAAVAEINTKSVSSQGNENIDGGS